MTDAIKQPNIVTSLPEVPITVKRRLPDNLDQSLPNPGLPRANVAASKEHPQGSPTKHNKPIPRSTVLQQHSSFWDEDKDGVLWPGETYRGFKRLGLNALVSAVGAAIINGAFSYWTSPSWIPDPFFRVYLSGIHRCKHGSDSNTYDEEGRFVPEKFEEMFSKFDQDNKGGLYFNELMEMLAEKRNVLDPFGWTAAFLEWGTTYWLAAQPGPDSPVPGEKKKKKMMMIAKEDIRAIYDGTFFEHVAERVEGGKLRKPLFQAGLVPVSTMGGGGKATRKEE
jgi:peroxygenase